MLRWSQVQIWCPSFNTVLLCVLTVHSLLARRKCQVIFPFRGFSCSARWEWNLRKTDAKVNGRGLGEVRSTVLEIFSDYPPASVTKCPERNSALSEGIWHGAIDDLHGPLTQLMSTHPPCRRLEVLKELRLQRGTSLLSLVFLWSMSVTNCATIDWKLI